MLRLFQMTLVAVIKQRKWCITHIVSALKITTLDLVKDKHQTPILPTDDISEVGIVIESDNCSSCSCKWVFLKFTQRVTILQTVSNQEVTLKRLISMMRIAQKLYVGA